MEKRLQWLAMFVRSTGPAQIHCIVEEGDPVVLTNIHGTVVSGPHPAPPTSQQLVIAYDGAHLDEVCWGVLNPDGTLAYQSKTFGPVYRHQNVNLIFDPPPFDDNLTHDDRSWLKRMARAVKP